MVYLKLHEIMQKIGYVQRDQKIDMGSKGSYNAVTEGRILQKIRPLLIEYGLVIVPEEVTKLEKTGSVTTLAMKYRVIDVTDGDQITISSIGQGSSTGDKGAGAAMTYAGKYALMKTLLLETGDDPDKRSDVKINEELDELSVLAQKITEEIKLLQNGDKINAETANAMIKYINAHKTDKAVLREAETSVQKLKTQTGV